MQVLVLNVLLLLTVKVCVDVQMVWEAIQPVLPDVMATSVWWMMIVVFRKLALVSDAAIHVPVLVEVIRKKKNLLFYDHQ